jgi:hypothetical protein
MSANFDKAKTRWMLKDFAAKCRRPALLQRLEMHQAVTRNERS